MARTAWEALVERYADGRPLCNCRQAYYSPCGVGSAFNPATGKYENRTDLLVCKHGCQSNQIAAKNEIAEKIVEEMEKK